ncbi:MAG: hypothetical protein ACPGLV_12795 [Bacteroidia bacterium]
MEKERNLHSAQPIARWIGVTLLFSFLIYSCVNEKSKGENDLSISSDTEYRVINSNGDQILALEFSEVGKDQLAIKFKTQKDTSENFNLMNDQKEHELNSIFLKKSGSSYLVHESGEILFLMQDSQIYGLKKVEGSTKPLADTVWFKPRKQ